MEPAVSSLTSNFSREGDVPPTLQGGVGSHAPGHTHPLLEKGLRVCPPFPAPPREPLLYVFKYLFL